MKAHTQSRITAESAGAAIGRVWRKWLRREQRVVGLAGSEGLHATIAKAALRIVTFTLLCVLLYTAFWLALLLVFATVVASGARDPDVGNEPDASAFGEEAGHKKSVFYDPINHNDDPDPRFEGE